MSPSKKNDLERDFAPANYLSGALSPPRFLSWGASSKCVVSESGKIQSVNIKYSICSPTQLTDTPPLHYTLHTCLYLYLFTLGRGGGGVEPERREKGQPRGEYRSQSWVEHTNMTLSSQEIGLYKLCVLKWGKCR